MANTQCTTSKCQFIWLLILRVAIGWHFLYEGVSKLLNPNWSSIGYLLDSKGFLSSFYHTLAANPKLLEISNFMNEWGLTLIGLALILGAFTRVAAYAGMVLLAFYYFSHPPFIGLSYAMPTEGSYLFIDKVFIEFCAMGVLALFPTGKYIGLDRFLSKK
ncbi:MAG: DoxX family protein [Chlorobi bacterium]|nr:DoxX family protein [Chlorobiota bacterium]